MKKNVFSIMLLAASTLSAAEFFVDFNAVQIMTSVFIGLVFLPLSRFMIRVISSGERFSFFMI